MAKIEKPDKEEENDRFSNISLRFPGLLRIERFIFVV